MLICSSLLSFELHAKVTYNEIGHELLFEAKESSCYPEENSNYGYFAMAKD